MANDQEPEDYDHEESGEADPDNDNTDSRGPSDFISASERLNEFIKKSYPNPMADFAERMQQAMPSPSEELLKALGRVQVPPVGIDYAKVLKNAQPAFDQ